jgi:uncharacterized repeat protein (TIGR01451 family)
VILTPAGHPDPLLSLVKTANVKTAAPGSTVVFTITVGDRSRPSAKNVVVCDTLPEGTLYVSASRAVDFHGDRACFNIGTLKHDQHASVRLTLQLAKTASGTITNHASATGTHCPTVFAQASVRVPAKPIVTPAPVTG